MKKGIISLLFCIAMTTTLLVGCGSKEEAMTEPTTESVSAEVSTITEEASTTEESTEIHTESATAEEETTLRQTSEVQATEPALKQSKETQTEATTKPVAELPAEKPASNQNAEVQAETPIENDIASQGLESQSEGNATATDKYVPGTWDGMVYTNPTLNFTMTFPDNYTIITGEALQNSMEETTGTYDFKAVSPDQLSSFLLTVEANTNGITAEEYKDTLLKSLENSGVTYQLFDDSMLYEEDEDGLDACGIAIIIDYSQQTGVENSLSPRYYLVLTDNNYIYYFTIDIMSRGAIAELESIVNSFQSIE